MSATLSQTCPECGEQCCNDDVICPFCGEDLLSSDDTDEDNEDGEVTEVVIGCPCGEGVCDHDPSDFEEDPMKRIMRKVGGLTEEESDAFDIDFSDYEYD